MAFQNRTWTSPISQLSVYLFGSWERPSPLYCHSLLARLPFNQEEMAASSLKLEVKGKFWDMSLALQKFYAKLFLCNLFHKASKLEPYCCCTIYYNCLKWFIFIYDIFMKKSSWQSLAIGFKKINSCAFAVDTWREKSQDVFEYWFCLTQSQNSKIYLSTLDRVWQQGLKFEWVQSELANGVTKDKLHTKCYEN